MIIECYTFVFWTWWKDVFSTKYVLFDATIESVALDSNSVSTYCYNVAWTGSFVGTKWVEFGVVGKKEKLYQYCNKENPEYMLQ